MPIHWYFNKFTFFPNLPLISLGQAGSSGSSVGAVLTPLHSMTDWKKPVSLLPVAASEGSVWLFGWLADTRYASANAPTVHLILSLLGERCFWSLRPRKAETEASRLLLNLEVQETSFLPIAGQFLAGLLGDQAMCNTPPEFPNMGQVA